MTGEARRRRRKSSRMNGRGTSWGMNQETQSIVVALLGGLLLSITLSGRFTSYVRPGFKPLLLIGGGILVIVGVASLILAIRADLTAERSRKAAAALVGGPAPGPGGGPDDQNPDDPPPHNQPHPTISPPTISPPTISPPPMTSSPMPTATTTRHPRRPG